ncbi:hypothetical protein SAMN04244553_1006 [Nocardia amikacinitolerans]|uniref:Uncharacterized protein n=1 Tax=Nocardia amikacinitolerans TaxID=756689 RepID=A0A285KXQ7_9NOCA|nr:hypothetical protein [Nocardia amikacinitolerans]SNY77434.1 hypothetical protein SAMN04244553_1006 [Nocardia amikacinitolerans]
MSDLTPDQEDPEPEVTSADGSDADSLSGEHRLTLGITVDGRVTARPYGNLPEQHLVIVDQADGSKGIRNMFSNMALGMTAAGVTARRYDGLADQSFTITTEHTRKKKVRCKYDRNIVLATPSSNNVLARPEQYTTAEAFDVVTQPHYNSTGIRNAYF